MALKNIKVVELAGLAPAPFCGMVLADFGASVIRVDKVNSDTSHLDCLANGKKSLALNLKSSEGRDVLKRLCNNSDVLIEPFRAGVMEKLGLSPNILLKENPRLIYARLTGFGQTGPYSSMAGHDINYVAISGLLSLFGRKNEPPIFPVNLAADFGGGGLTCALGILLALFEREKSGLGQVVDSAMVDGTAYLGSWLFRSQNLPIWGNKRGENILDSGAHFYEVYETKDNKYISVGALENQFYEILIEKLAVPDMPQYYNFEGNKKILKDLFKTKTRNEWCEIFDGTDACVAPVLNLDEVSLHSHNKARKTFRQLDGVTVPNPAPALSRTPGVTTATKKISKHGEDTVDILQSLGYNNDEINQLSTSGVVKIAKESSKL